jgi:hypothetical protein
VNPTVSNATLVAIERQVLEDSFYLFVKEAWPQIDTMPFKDGWHVKAICDHLQAVAEGRITRLLINIPPGLAKSLLSSVLFPVWIWTRDPTKSFLSTSYAMELATRDARKSRALIQSEWFQKRWPIELEGDQNQKTNYVNAEGGFRNAKSFEGMTGGRAHYVIIDDPHSVKMAGSEVERTSTVDTFLEAIPSRVIPGVGAIIVIMQRLHEEDVSGVILERLPEYDHLCIPMEWDGPREPTSIGWVDPRREDGELLFPKHYTPDDVDTFKRSLGPVAYAGQFQQTPYPKDAGIIDTKWFNRFDLKKEDGSDGYPAGCNFYMVSDHAQGGKDYNVVQIWALDFRGNLWLVDQFRKRCLPDEAFGVTVDEDTGKFRLQKAGALSLIFRWRPKAFFPEDDGTWKTIGGLFKRMLRETSLHTFCNPQTPHGLGDKTNKLQSFIAIASLGQVYIPRNPIGEDFISEARRFPAGKNDDMVDCAAMIGRVYHKLHKGLNKDPKTREPDFLEYSEREDSDEGPSSFF